MHLHKCLLKAHLECSQWKDDSQDAILMEGKQGEPVHLDFFDCHMKDGAHYFRNDFTSLGTFCSSIYFIPM